MKTFLIIFAVIFWINGAFSEDKNYFFSYPLKTNWFKAVEACKFKNMELVSVLTPESLKDVQSYIDDLKINTWFDEWTNSIWTSGNDLGEQGQYACVSTGKHISGQMLENEHVDNHNHGVCMTEHCLTLVRKSSNLFIYNDDLCSNQRYFLCEERVIPDVPAIENVSENKLLLSGDVLPLLLEAEDESNHNTEAQHLPIGWRYTTIR